MARPEAKPPMKWKMMPKKFAWCDFYTWLIRVIRVLLFEDGTQMAQGRRGFLIGYLKRVISRACFQHNIAVFTTYDF
jgi:hypothetical protein